MSSGTASEDPSPPKSKQPEDSKDPSPPEPKPQDSAEDDLLEFTSATEGEASSSAWELVPEKKIARKKGVKSDSEIDSLLKKVIKEAEEPDPSKDVLTTKLGRKNLMTPGVTADDEDSEMAEADPAAASHLGASSKRKGRSTSQGAAKKRGFAPKSPRTSSVGAKAKSPPPPANRPASANKMPRSTSPQGKAESKVAGKPAVKPPPKSITPLSAHAAAKPPPKAVTSKAATEKETKAWEDWEKTKAKVADRERMEAAAPKSPPLFAHEWQRFTSRESFLQKTAETYRLDPNSAEGYNHHVASYYYVSTDWGVSHPQSYSSIMLKCDSKQSHRWTCVHCRSSHPEIADHKTVEEGMIHWWRNHCHHSSWVWCEKATVFNITTAEVCKAVLNIDLSDQPLPLGGAFHMLPNALPSHPKGLDKRLFKPPYSKTLTPAHHPSEQGLPWNHHIEQLAREPEVELTSWGWVQFFASVLEGNSDVLCFLIHPFSRSTSAPGRRGTAELSPPLAPKMPRITSWTLSNTRLCS